ncbi:MAG TPA: hypothetical protein VGW39_07545 [Chthoniobacterales bacterium]|nr:hypothetical protein [Chthoniobacterales bacterium]
MKTISALFALGLAFLGYAYLQRPISYPAGVLVGSVPAQVAIADGEAPIEHGEYTLKPLARFSLDGRILHRKVYRYDRQAKLVPIDLAVGWGPMSDQSVLDQIKITQSMRFYWYEYRSPPPIPKERIISHSTNLHVIPATSAVLSFCKSLRQGELVHLEGELVEATGPEMGIWRSSLSRTDTGNGACELMLVQDCSKIGRPENKPARLVRR